MATKSTKRQVKEPTLPDSELEALRVLWNTGRGSVRDVWSQLRRRGSKWTYATVNTLLQRLETKGLVACDRSQMSFTYAPKISKQQVIKKRVRQLVDKLYDGRSGMLVMHLLKSQRLSRDEKSEIHEMLRSAGGP